MGNYLFSPSVISVDVLIGMRYSQAIKYIAENEVYFIPTYEIPINGRPARIRKIELDSENGKPCFTNDIFDPERIKVCLETGFITKIVMYG